MASEIQQFITRTQIMIDKNGLQGMSGVRFDRGQTPMDAIKFFKRQAEFDRLSDDPFTPVRKVGYGEIAKELNAIQDCMDADENDEEFPMRVIFRKRKTLVKEAQKRAKTMRPYEDNVTETYLPLATTELSEEVLEILNNVSID